MICLPVERIIQSIIALISLILLYISGIGGNTRIVIYIIVAFIGGFYFGKSSLSHIYSKRKVTNDVIMTIAVIGSAILGELEESLTIAFLYSITETLESYTVKRTKTSIKSLINLVPKEVVRLEGNTERTLNKITFALDVLNIFLREFRII